MNKLLKSILTIYVVVKVAPIIVKGSCIIVDVIARGIVSKLDDVLFNEMEDNRKRTRRHLRRTYYKGY